MEGLLLNWIDKTDLDSVALETRAMHRYGADESSAPTCIDGLSWVCVDDALAPQDMFHVKQRKFTMNTMWMRSMPPQRY